MKGIFVRFFTPTQLRRFAVPNSQDFKAVVDVLRSSLQEAYSYQEPRPSPGSLDKRRHPIWFAGGIVIGSVARGSDLRRTSDIDVLLFFDDSLAATYLFLNYMRELRSSWASKIKGYKEDLNIPINLYLVTTSRLRLPKTRLDSQFLGHAMRSLDGLPEHTGEDALLCGDATEIRKIFDLAPKLTREHAEHYVTKKFETLHNAYGNWEALTEEEMVTALASAVNGPFHGARQLLNCFNIPYKDTKIGVIEACQGADMEDFAESLAEIHEQANRYEREVDAYLSGYVSTYYLEDRIARSGILSLEMLLQRF